MTSGGQLSVRHGVAVEDAASDATTLRTESDSLP
jgi:hypothetical protein